MVHAVGGVCGHLGLGDCGGGGDGAVAGDVVVEADGGRLGGGRGEMYFRHCGECASSHPDRTTSFEC